MTGARSVDHGSPVKGKGSGITVIVLSVVIVLFGLHTVIASAAQNQQIAQKLAELQKLSGKFTFIVIGDTRTGDDFYRKIVSLVAEHKPDFVLNTGDMIEKPGNLEQWDNFWKLSAPITVPYFLIVGNHDAHPKVPFSEKIYKEQVDLPGNELYYSFSAGNSLFVVLDSYLDDQEKRITGAQLKWLEDVLVNSPAKHKFVFLHHPLYTDEKRGKHAGSSLDKYPEERDRLAALFKRTGVDAVFAGHEHYYQRKTVDGIMYVITGGGGAPLYGSEEQGGFHHFVQVTVDGDKVNAKVVDIRGEVQDRF